MIRWIPYAFVRIVLFFAIGICLGIFQPDILNIYSTILIFFALVAVYGVIAVCSWQQRFRKSGATLKFLAGMVGLLAIFFAGYLHVLSNDDVRKADHLVHINSPVDYVKIVLTKAPVEKTNSWKIEGSVQTVKTDEGWKTCSANILLYFSKHDFPTSFQYGDVLLVRGQPQGISGPANPEEFNYKRFLSFRNIHHQLFVKKADVKRIGFDPPNWLNHYAFICRKWADDVLERNISGDREQALATALVLGVTDGLDNELLSAYKATGAMHVLAVSGLHVGILYGILLFALKPLHRLKFGPWILAGISILVLWGYAFVTGLSPSVLRAVTMFSFVALAKPAGHRTNIYNTLAASAFCVLWYDPFFLMSVGFQLSYLAVLGIVYMQSGLYNLWEPNNRWLDEMWKVTCVSIAAQLATVALGLFYFHQFPNYFLLSNLFVIPGSFLVLLLGLAILVTGFIPPIASALGFVMEWIIKALNFIVFAIEDFPFSVIENVYITPFQCWLLMGTIVVVLVSIQTRRFTWVWITFFLGIVFSFTQWYHFQTDIRVQKFMVYNVSGHSAIDLIDHGNVYFIADSALQDDRSKISFHITPHRIKIGGKTIQPGNVFQRKLSGCALMVWKGKSFLQIYDPNFSIPVGVSVDYLIISRNAVKNLQELYQYIHMGQIILDSSNSRFLAEKLLEKNRNLQDKIYSVLHQGAFELQI
jgi:competence protein ComEC